MEKQRKRDQYILFVIYCAVMLLLLFFRRTVGRADTYWETISWDLNYIPFRTIGSYLYVLFHGGASGIRLNLLINLIGNVILFIPLGYFLPLLSPKNEKWGRTTLISLLLIVSVEVIQLFSLKGSCDVDDLILNMLGVEIGFVIYRRKKKRASV